MIPIQTNQSVLSGVKYSSIQATGKTSNKQSVSTNVNNTEIFQFISQIKTDSLQKLNRHIKKKAKAIIIKLDV